MWLNNSSIGRKVIMSVTGMALILFLTFHASMNVVALISAKGYNLICEFLGANWYAVVATIGLGCLVLLHFVYAFILTIQNRKARGNNRYAVTSKPEKVEWASQNMFVLGIIVLLGMGLHLYNFWYNMMYAELAHVEEAEAMAANGAYHIAQTFSRPGYTAIYVVWLCALWFHMTHGFWSALQTMGWNSKVWFNRWKVVSVIYSTVIILMFAAVTVAFAAGYRPADFDEAVQPKTECVEAGCAGKMKACGAEKSCGAANSCDADKACEKKGACCKAGAEGKGACATEAEGCQKDGKDCANCPNEKK